MTKSAVLIGQPDSGKSNFLGRAWKDMQSPTSALSFVDADNITYLEELLEHLLKGKFAPRSDKNIEQSRHDITLHVRQVATGSEFDIVVPDVTGELWKAAVAHSDLPQAWMDSLEEASGALLFLRVGSEENHQPLDWVASRKLLALLGSSGSATAIPTQVVYAELLRFLQVKLGLKHPTVRRRVAIAITAWDQLDPEYRIQSPLQFMRKEFPLLAGKIENISNLEIRLFGVSVVGGDLQNDEQFLSEYKSGNIEDFGYTVIVHEDGTVAQKRDLTIPLNWLMEP